MYKEIVGATHPSLQAWKVYQLSPWLSPIQTQEQGKAYGIAVTAKKCYRQGSELMMTTPRGLLRVETVGGNVYVQCVGALVLCPGNYCRKCTSNNQLKLGFNCEPVPLLTGKDWRHNGTAM